MSFFYKEGFFRGAWPGKTREWRFTTGRINASGTGNAIRSERPVADRRSRFLIGLKCALKFF